MTGDLHPNVAVLQALDWQDLDASKHRIADQFVWHYVNPALPALNGDYHGVDGLKVFFVKLSNSSNGSFQRDHIETRTAGDELVVSQVCNRMALQGRAFEVDAVVVWRIVDGKILEAWDIPAINTVRPAKPG